MPLDWDALQTNLSPVKDYDDLCHRLRSSYAFPFVTASFDFTLPQLVDYTHAILGGDSRQRYTGYLASLESALSQLGQAGVSGIIDLLSRVDSRQKLEQFVDNTRVHPSKVVPVLKFLLYWLVPGEKYLSGLVRDDPIASQTIKALSTLGIRTNLQLLQHGLTPSARQVLANDSGLPMAAITDLVNRADFSRLPWASKATISNIIGAGYASLQQLANAEPEQLYADFFRYGQSIGKNLKLGNEIENSYRIARIVPVILQND
jgi:hypothetical protein